MHVKQYKSCFYFDSLRSNRKISKHSLHILIIFFLFTFLLNNVQAQSIPPAMPDTFTNKQLPSVLISGKTSKTILSPEAISGPASVTIAGKEFIAKQALFSYGDLLRPIAGVTVSNYQLGGVGYGIQMRGYTVTEHARDVAFFIDGVPQNQGSSIQANGYVDLNPLIPENLQRFEVIRGPFSPFYGDHALGGAITFETANRLPTSIMISGGSFGTARALATVGFGKNKHSGYVSVEGFRTDAYRDNNDEKRLNGYAKYAFPFAKGMATVSAQAFTADFNSAGYLKVADIEAGTVKTTSAISASDGGSTKQQNLVFNYKGADSSNFTSATIYVQHHDFIRIRTGVIGGPQRKDRDNRTWFGGDLRRTLISTLGSIPVLYAAGISFRGDLIENTRFATVDRQEISQSRDRQIKTYTPAAYAQIQLQPAKRLKLTLGARYDQLFYNLNTGANDAEVKNLSVKPKTGVFSPKVGIAYRVASGMNVFFNASKGFKAPSGYEENLFNPDLSVSKLTSYELGIAGDGMQGRLHGLISGYISDQNGEIQEDPLGNLVNFGNTRRTGIEAEFRAIVTNNGALSIYGNFTRVWAKIRNGAPDQVFVTNTPEYAALIGFDYDFGTATNAKNHFVLSIFDQFIGNKNLDAAGTIRTDAFQRFSGRINYTRPSWANFLVFVQGNVYVGDGALNEMRFLSGGNVLTSPQASSTFLGGIKIAL